MGPTIGAWEVADWSKVDDRGNGTLWLNRSIATWMTTATQWHMNAYSAITLLNTRSMSVAVACAADKALAVSLACWSRDARSDSTSAKS
eukprot:2110163-Amphidinium_carterae.1